MNKLQHEALSWLEHHESKDDRLKRAISYVGRTWLVHLLMRFAKDMREADATNG